MDPDDLTTADDLYRMLKEALRDLDVSWHERGTVLVHTFAGRIYFTHRENAKTVSYPTPLAFAHAIPQKPSE